MKKKLIRVYKELDTDDIMQHLLICGELTGSCGKCNAVGLKTDLQKCPECQTDFKYLTFRNIKSNIHKITKINETRSGIVIIDFDDYKKATGAQKAQDFFK